jgi:hypothetical protein
MPTRRTFFKDIFSGLSPQTGINSGDRVIVVPESAPPKLLALSDIGQAGGWKARSPAGQQSIGSTSYKTLHSYTFSVPSDGVYLFFATCSAGGAMNPSSNTTFFINTQFQAPDGTSSVELLNCGAWIEPAGASHTHSLYAPDHRHTASGGVSVYGTYLPQLGVTQSGGSSSYPDGYIAGSVSWLHVMELVAGSRTGYVNCKRSTGTWFSSNPYKYASEMSLIKLS